MSDELTGIINDWWGSAIPVTAGYLARRITEAGYGKVDELRSAATQLLTTYIDLVNCGDCGNWDPEKDDSVIMLRDALAKLGVE